MAGPHLFIPFLRLVMNQCAKLLVCFSVFLTRHQIHHHNEPGSRVTSPAAQPSSVMSGTIIHQRFCLKLDLLLKIFNIISVSSGTRVDHVLEKGKYLNIHLEQSSSWKSARKSWKSCYVPQHVFCRVAFELRLIISVSRAQECRRPSVDHTQGFIIVITGKLVIRIF